ncbi:hypothetical protein [Limnoraphis robusta]|uniref:Uncharacterized protein n=1 Tax=Limnoraphis robusta CCNP1315 TaxID=3110306 RepID=A0ABU5U755_9CYAN|nr:hypothetical protein [Limnoraphis robusta]MEA5522880.1 hypothetical protein [Limnoraphis robusta CCNP1315]MEA5546858.1 hypothetical protein [Limnoraphis robusta CCNP1324]
MFFSILFNKYYDQISSALLSEHKKYIGKIHIRDIQPSFDAIANYGFSIPTQHAQNLVQSFHNRYQVTFKPLAFPEDSLKETVKNEIELEWSGFFKALTVLIDNHDFYKAIETVFQRRYQGIVHATEILAKSVKLIAEIAKNYDEAVNVGNSRAKLLKGLQYLAADSQLLMSRYYTQIECLRDEFNHYSSQTVESLQQAKQSLSLEVEKLIGKERSTQSEYAQFFMAYRLRITQQIDSICDSLKTFSFRGQEMRSHLIEYLTDLQDRHPDQLELMRGDLNQEFTLVWDELKQMQAVENADKKARQAIQSFANSTQLEFFQDVAEVKQQIALRGISDTIRESVNLLSIQQKIELIEQEYYRQVNDLAEVERQYSSLRTETLDSLECPVKFTFDQLNLASTDIFVPVQNSYRLVVGKLKEYGSNNEELLNQLTTDGMLLGISDLGQVIEKPIQVSTSLKIEKICQEIERKIIDIGLENRIGFMQVLLDEGNNFDKPAILFFTRQPQTYRPEITALLEVTHEGKLAYIRKLVCICPLPSHLLNTLLEGYKTTFKNKNREVIQLIADEFLANKLKLDFQSKIAQAMVQTKQRLRDIYLENLREDTLQKVVSEDLENNIFLKNIDELIIKALDVATGFEDKSEELKW